MSDLKGIQLYTDGGSRGNPGEAAIGYILYDEQGSLLYEYGAPIGVQTNNHAEYKAMIEGLRRCLTMGCVRVVLSMDSELVVKQIKGEYKVRNQELKRLYEEATGLISKLEYFEIRHVRRENNKEADRLVNLALDSEAVHQKNDLSVHEGEDESQVTVLKGKIQKLHELIAKEEKVLIAFSGGVDSSLLAYICRDLLRDRACCVTIRADNLSQEELKSVESFVCSHQMKHCFLDVDIYENSDLLCNEEERCYHCKRQFFQEIRKLAERNQIETIYDGSNADDRLDYRPGMRAALEFGVKSPLLEAGFTKQDIRNYSRQLGLDTAEKEAMPCLITRIPYGYPVKSDQLRRIEQAETFIRSLGYCQVRVRAYGNMAKIEMDETQVLVFMNSKDYISVREKLSTIGFEQVVLDLNGYQRTSVNEME